MPMYKIFFYLGVLACLDGYMNVALEQTEEYVDGQVDSLSFVLFLFLFFLLLINFYVFVT